MDALTELLDAARSAQARAYAPYSHYAVGAALRSSSGAIFSGCNVENASFPAGTCAETNAIGAMIVAGASRITEILVIGDGEPPIAPCGSCRQRIFEFASADTKIHSADSTGVKTSYRMADLLPHAFGPDNLAQRQRSTRDKP